MAVVPADNNVGSSSPPATGSSGSDSDRRDGGRAGAGRASIIHTHGRSVVSRARANSPLRLLTPRNTGHAAWLYTSTYGGGLVEGDELALSLDVGPAATALVSTQASTKIYRSPAGSGAGTRSDLAADVSGDGTLILLPDPVVCYADARYRQRQTVDLHARASLLLLDWISCGRRARGERWAFGEYRTSLRIRRDAALICQDGLTLLPEDGAFSDRLDRFEALATIVLIGPGFRERAREVLARFSAEPVVRRADLLQVAAPLGDAGCLVRMAGVSLEQVARAVRRLLGFLPEVLGDDPWARKW